MALTKIGMARILLCGLLLMMLEFTENKKLSLHKNEQIIRKVHINAAQAVKHLPLGEKDKPTF